MTIARPTALETGKGSRLTIVPQRSPDEAPLPLSVSSATGPMCNRRTFGGTVPASTNGESPSGASGSVALDLFVSRRERTLFCRFMRWFFSRPDRRPWER